MPPAVPPSSAPDEVALVRLAFHDRRASLDSLAAHLHVARTTLSNWLCGHRGTPAGLLLALGDHLDLADRAWLLEQLAARWGLLVEVRLLTPRPRAVVFAELGAALVGLLGALLPGGRREQLRPALVLVRARVPEALAVLEAEERPALRRAA